MDVDEADYLPPPSASTAVSWMWTVASALGLPPKGGFLIIFLRSGASPHEVQRFRLSEGDCWRIGTASLRHFVSFFSSSDWLKFWGSHGEMQAEERDRVCSLGKEKILQRLRGLETLEASSRARCSVAAVFAERFSFGLGAILSFSEAVRVKARTWRVFGAKKRFKKLRFLPLLCRIEAAIAVISVLFWRFLKLSLAPLKCSPWRDKLRTPKRGELESVGRQIQVSGATGGGWGFSPAVAHPSSLLIFYSAAKRESLSFPFPF